MGRHTEVLRDLAGEIFASDIVTELFMVARMDRPVLEKVIAFDLRLGGPSFTTVNHGTGGRYEGDDRDVFRPFQYCTAYFHQMLGGDINEWQAREIVKMSSLHLEALVKRTGNVINLPLGQALRNVVAKRRIDPATWNQLDRYTRIYNAAKHAFDHDKDTHMFSVEDAILAYFVCRGLGAKLYPLANLATNLQVFAS